MIIDRPTNDQIPLLASLWREAFEDGEFFEVFKTSAFSIERCRCAILGDEVAGALYWFDCSCNGEKVAYLYAIATAKKYRSQGVCRALMEDTHSYLRSLGYSSAVLVPGNGDLFNFYGRMRYFVCSSVCEREFFADGQSRQVTPISRNEYAMARRRYLPEGGVIQEGENLELLERTTSLYVGEGFVMAAEIDENTLVCHEFLGNIDDIPNILNSLGCARGSFRYPGNDKRFAMCILLDEKATIPKYLGLAFD